MNQMAVEPRFRPARPRRPDAASTWDVLFGAHARNAVEGWPPGAFEVSHMTRRWPGFSYHAVNHPDLIQRVLLDNAANYGKPELMRRLIGRSLAGGLFLEEGDEWRRQRRLMEPAFTPAAIERFYPLFADSGRRAADRWAAAPGETFDAAADATRAAFQVIGRSLFSTERGLVGDEAARQVDAFLLSAMRPLAVFGGLGWLDWTGRTQRGRAAEAWLVRKVAAHIAARQADPDPPDDFMSGLLAAFAEDHPPEAAARLALQNAITFLIAGHETTANALAWTLYLLSEDRQAQAWAAEEAREALTVAPDPKARLGRLVYLRMVLEEAMRLYPPAPRLERQAIADDALGELEVKAGDMVGVWPWVVHRHRWLWRDPDAFDPENFAPEAKAGRHRFQYIPFGAGPRICIGAQFAMAEALLILAEWLARFEFAPEPGHKVEAQCDITLKPKGGLPLRVTPRRG